MTKRYVNVQKFIAEHPWAILPATLDILVEIMELRLEGSALSDEEIRARVGGTPPPRPAPQQLGSVAVIPLHGVIAPRMNLMTEVSGGTSAAQLQADLMAAARMPEVSAIVLDVDSPGGSVFGISEAASTIRAVRREKPVVAVANHTAASAAYWLASQADELIVSPSSQVGSVGVVAVHQDMSGAAEKAGVKTTFVTAGKYKAEGNSMTPLNDEARAHMQGLVNTYYDAFVRGVAKGRGVSVDAVRDGFGEGRVVTSESAVRLGMADGVATLGDVIGRIAATGVKRRALSAMRAETSYLTPVTVTTNGGAVVTATTTNGSNGTTFIIQTDESTAEQEREQKAQEEREAAVKAEADALRERLAALNA
jgi:capsid assembly protease